MSYPNLLSPLKKGPFEVKNRVALAPMTRGRATEDGAATPVMADYYAQRSGAGLVIAESTCTSILANGWYRAPAIYTREHSDAWKPVVQKVHDAGGKIFCQLWHSGRASHSAFRDGVEGYEGDMKKGVAPSAIKRKSRSGKQSHTPRPGQVDIEEPRALSTDEVHALPHEYRNAAQMAKDAGFDGVEIHSANGFLLDTFLQSCSNKRTDEYGGSLENRFRLLEKIIRAILTVYQPHQVAVRLSPNGNYNGMGSEDFREAFLYYAERLKEFGLAYLHLMIGLGFGFHELGKSFELRDFREVYPGVIMGNVGFTPESAEKVIADGDADMISFGRPFIGTPDLVERLEAGVPLNEESDMSLWYSSVEKPVVEEGYTDYKTMAEQRA